MSYSPALQELFASLNPHQVEAVNIGGGLCCLVGVPGSGKTKTLVARIARMAADGLDPEYVLAMTFTKAAAMEMTTRLQHLGVSKARVGTIHSVCRQIAAAETHMLAHGRLDERDRLTIELKKLLSELRRKGAVPEHGVDFEAVQRYVEACKASGLCYVDGDPFGLNMASEANLRRQADAWTRLTSVRPERLVALYTEFEKRRGSAGLYSFDDMLLWAWLALVSNPDARLRWRQRWAVVIVDECQDSNPVQWDIARLLVGLESCLPVVSGLACAPARDAGQHNLMTVGDSSQCHPPGVQVDGTPVEALRDGMRVRGWNRHAQKMVGGREIKVSSRRYRGHLLTITAAGRKTRMTPNHRLICRWTDRLANTCVVYLMYRHGFGYRVGWCQLFIKRASGGGLHPSVRARIEKADALWILSAHRTRAEASMHESIVAAKFGLPTITFEPVNGAQHLTASVIEGVFAALRDDNEERGLRCLAAYGRNRQLPLYPWPNKPTGAFSRATYFEVFASNLLPGLMSVPLPEGRNNWASVESVSSERYDGLVYSLDVAQDHSYAADGIVVLNSIYKWRSADPSLFVQFAKNPEVKTLVLPLNYRSNQTICSVATGLVRARAWHLGGEITAVSESPAPKAIAIKRYDSVEEEAENLVKRCMEHAQDEGLRSCAVLSRLRVGLDLVEIACIRNRIKYIKMASGSFFESKEVRDVLAYLRVSANLDPDGSWLRHIINKPFRYIGVQFINKAAAWGEGRGLSLLDGMVELSDELAFKQRNALRQFVELLQKLNKIHVASELRAQSAAGAQARGQYTSDEELVSESEAPAAPEGPADMIGLVLQKTGYIEELRREEGLLGMDESRIAALAALRRMAFMFPTAAQFLAYVDALTVAVQEARRVGLKLAEGSQEDALVLSTIHRCKGLEWSHIFLMDVVQGRFPCAKSMDPDEELRLLYVALTRAKETCQISYAGPEDSRGSRTVKSAFIIQIEAELGKLAASVPKVA